jgi:hypothetical protein
VGKREIQSLLGMVTEVEDMYLCVQYAHITHPVKLSQIDEMRVR